MTRPRVAPYLTVTPAAAAIGFYTAAFGAKQVALMPSVDGLRIAHCELLINGGSVMLADAFLELGQTRAPMPGEQVTMSVSLEYDTPKQVDDICARSGQARRQDRDAADQFLLAHPLRQPARPLRPPLDFQRAAAEVNSERRAAPMRPRCVSPKAVGYFRPKPRARSKPICARWMSASRVKSSCPDSSPRAPRRSGANVDMRAIIGRGADPRPREIEDHAQIRREEQQGAKAPAAARARVNKKGGRHERRPFQSQ